MQTSVFYILRLQEIAEIPNHRTPGAQPQLKAAKKPIEAQEGLKYDSSKLEAPLPHKRNNSLNDTLRLHMLRLAWH